MIVTSQLLAAWTDAWSTDHAGWDFSDVASGTGESPTPWDFEDQCVRAMRDGSSVLDMGTGGREQLLRLLDAAGASIARTRVVATTAGHRTCPWPGRPSSHAASWSWSTTRTGALLTQQVGSRDAEQTRTWFGTPRPAAASRWS
ncbi:hypothetical protein GCM10009740_35660 [Terrabacter terrae]|uniref:Uncharacterized protein n=1 Tax=Terrabacter terrae TaxID=318434 RepID=A0ABN2UN64_9MICO